MATKANLRAVKADETAQPKSDGTVSGALSTRDLLVAMRNRIAKAIDDPNTPARDLAALTKRIGEVVRDIEAIDARDHEDEEGPEVEDGDFDAASV